MNILTFFYNEFLWRPLFNGLVWFYSLVPFHDLGIAIILLTIAIRLVLTPLFWKAQKTQKNLATLQPEIKRIQEELKQNREAQGKALMGLYAKHNVNPFSGCLVLLIQLPILIALFNVFRSGLDPTLLSYLYPFVQNPGSLNHVAFGILDLSMGSIYLGVIAALSQFFQTKMMMVGQPQSAQNDFARMMQWQTLYIFPAIILVWSYTLPSALTLYWTILNIFGIVQEVVMKKNKR